MATGMTKREPLPHVPFEFFGFLMILGFLLERQHRFDETDAAYVRAMARVRW